jgi:S-disulfanyl-L-cysteine oxidoreductase SoxD
MGWCSVAKARHIGRRKRLPHLVILTASLGICQVGWTQSPTYGIGRTPTAEEMRAWDISISPTGKELPPGHGTAKEGAALYLRKGCAGCHGASGYSAGHAPTLIRRKDPPPAASAPPVMCLAPCVNDSNTMAIHSPFATTIWDYINRGMPLGKEGTLTPDEVYALTAFLLYKNDVIREDEVMDAQSLPKVKMPNRDGFALPEPWKHGNPRLQGYP